MALNTEIIFSIIEVLCSFFQYMGNRNENFKVIDIFYIIFISLTDGVSKTYQTPNNKEIFFIHAKLLVLGISISRFAIIFDCQLKLNGIEHTLMKNIYRYFLILFN